MCASGIRYGEFFSRRILRWLLSFRVREIRVWRLCFFHRYFPQWNARLSSYGQSRLIHIRVHYVRASVLISLFVSIDINDILFANWYRQKRIWGSFGYICFGTCRAIQVSYESTWMESIEAIIIIIMYKLFMSLIIILMSNNKKKFIYVYLKIVIFEVRSLIIMWNYLLIFKTWKDLIN